MSVIVKSFARIHKDNLVNFGIMPLTFENPADYDSIDDGDELEFKDLRNALKSGDALVMRNATKNKEIKLRHGYTPRQVELILAGGTLNYTRSAP